MFCSYIHYVTSAYKHIFCCLLILILNIFMYNGMLFPFYLVPHINVALVFILTAFNSELQLHISPKSKILLKLDLSSFYWRVILKVKEKCIFIIISVWWWCNFWKVHPQNPNVRTQLETVLLKAPPDRQNDLHLSKGPPTPFIQFQVGYSHLK